MVTASECELGAALKTLTDHVNGYAARARLPQAA
jgi:hypothetical protein